LLDIIKTRDFSNVYKSKEKFNKKTTFKGGFFGLKLTGE